MTELLPQLSYYPRADPQFYSPSPKVNTGTMFCHRNGIWLRGTMWLVRNTFYLTQWVRPELKIQMWLLGFWRAREKTTKLILRIGLKVIVTTVIPMKYMTQFVFSLNLSFNIMKYVNWNICTPLPHLQAKVHPYGLPSTLKICNSMATLFMASWKSWIRNLRTLLLRLCTISPYSVTCHLLYVRVNLPSQRENPLKWVMNIRKGRKTQRQRALLPTKSYHLQKSKVRNSDQKKSIFGQICRLAHAIDRK